MSRLADSRSSVASKTAFDALYVEDAGDESEEEGIHQPTQHEEIHSEIKPSKSAIKRAQKQARTERRQQQKALARAQRNKAAEDSFGGSTDPSEDAGSVNHSSSDNDEDSPSQPEEPPFATPSNDVPSAALKEATASNGANFQPIVPTPEENTNGTHVHSFALEKSVVPSAPESQSLHVDQTKPESAAESAEKAKKRQSFLTRTLWTFIMIGGFIGLLLLGHAYMVLLVLLCQTLVYREVTALFSLKSQQVKNEDAELGDGKDPWSKTLNWYFFAVTNYFLYGESIIYYFKHVVFVDAQLLPFVTNHRMISFVLYTIGFVGFVMSLQKAYLKQQFGLFCWVHMSLLLIVVSSHFIVNNILEGLIWFWVPASLVICNDVFAYLWGITVGRTPLIKLSPKKTVEGFVGAFFSTIVFGLAWGTFFMRFKYMTCPVHELGVSAWDTMQCRPNPVFVWRDLAIWKPLAVFLSKIAGRSITTLSYTPYHYHLLFLSTFASLVAPFGGFFASGFKRAFNIKDFGHSIPGHGGMTDRMDCQFLMGVFTYVYYSSLIREHHVTVGGVLQTIVSGLTLEEQLELLSDLKRYLVNQGIQNP